MNPDFTSIVQALDRLTAVHQRNPWDYANVILVGLTLLVLIKYTLETSRLRKAAQAQTEGTAKLLEEAQKQNEAAQLQYEISTRLHTEAQRQNEISVMPMFAVYVNSNATQASFLMKNVGLGPAFNVLIKKLELNEETLQVLFGNTFMATGEVQELRFILALGEGRGQVLGVDELYQQINTGTLPNPLRIVISYVSLNLKSYECEFQCAPYAGRLKVSYYRQSSAIDLL